MPRQASPAAVSNARLCARYRAGDRHAAEELLAAHEGLVGKQVGKFLVGRGSMAAEDLMQEGRLGLLRAASTFDANRGSFSTYAVPWIRQFIRRAIENQGATIRLPTHISFTCCCVAQAKAKLESELGRESDLDEVANACGLSRQTVERLADLPEEPLSLDAAVGESGEATFADVMPGEGDPAPEIVNRVFVRDLLESTDLKPRERAVINARFGLEDGRERTLKEIAADQHVSREGVRHIETRALRKLRAAAAAEG